MYTTPCGRRISFGRSRRVGHDDDRKALILETYNLRLRRRRTSFHLKAPADGHVGNTAPPPLFAGTALYQTNTVVINARARLVRVRSPRRRYTDTRRLVPYTKPIGRRRRSRGKKKRKKPNKISQPYILYYYTCVRASERACARTSVG